jgi:putative membrane protein
MNAFSLLSLMSTAAGDGDHGWWPLFGLLWIAIFATIVWLLIRRGWGRGRDGDPLDRARGVLAERFARGEIGPEEYRERLAELR